MYNAKAYSASSATSPLAPTTIARRDRTDHDVQVEILFCGICHSDLHHVRNEWGSPEYMFGHGCTETDAKIKIFRNSIS